MHICGNISSSFANAQKSNKADQSGKENVKPEVTKSENLHDNLLATDPIYEIKRLQRYIGNQAVQRLIHSGIIQASLKTSHPSDPSEQEADKAAEEVMRMSAPDALSSRMSDKEEQLDRKCSACEMPKEEKEEEGQQLDISRKPSSAYSSGLKNNEITNEIDNVRASSGSALDANTEKFMESRFGYDFSNVRIHTGEIAARSSASVNALAYTVGNDIVFGEGQYQPGTSAGRKLLAHEMTHVVQQTWEEADPFLNNEEQEQGMRGPAHVVRQRSVPTYIQREPKDEGGPSESVPLEVYGSTFEEAAANFADIITEVLGVEGPARIVVVNGMNIRVFDETGKSLSKNFFHLQSAGTVPRGVFARIGRSAALYQLTKDSTGKMGRPIGPVQLKTAIDFSKDIDDQAGFEALLKGGGTIFYVSPTSTAVPEQAEAPAPIPIENLPEFMQFEAKNKANLPPWDSAVFPLTPQVATVNSMGSFKCRVEKDQGLTMIDRVTNLMQPTSFHWQVIKLDEKLKPKDTKEATRWAAVKEGYSRRLRDLEADKKTLQGDPKKQSTPETVVRAAMAEQVTQTRTILAMTGQTVMTAINAVTGGPNQLTTEDIIDVPFKEQGDYFVRCLATQVVPKDAKWRRATSVSGVMVSVFNIEDVARESLPTEESVEKLAAGNVAKVEEGIKQIEAEIEAGKGDPVILKAHRAHELLRLEYAKSLGAAGTDPHAQKAAELAFVRAQIAFFRSAEYPSDAKYEPFKNAKLKELETQEKTLSSDVRRMETKLKEHGSDITPTGYMPAILVDEYTGAQMPLSFAFGERTYVVADDLEVVIADVTSKKGKIFNGTGGGYQGAGREDAWLIAMDDLRKNLGRGRGYLSYEVPPAYAQYKSELPNPMQLQMGIGSQVKEMVDDTARAMTIVAIMAAPFTGGASLGILAVLAPVQAASSLYNIVNRSLYGDLELDDEAVFDFINIATLGFGKVSEAGKLSSKGVRIIATSSKVAIGILNGGQFALISYRTYQTLMSEGDPNDPNADPRELRRKKLLALLNIIEAASIPISQKLWGKSKLIEEPKGTPSDVEGGGLKPSKEPTLPAGDEGTAPKTSTEQGAPGTAGKPTTPTGEHIVPSLSKQQLKAIPKSLRETVVPVEGLGRNAKVVYELDSNGLIKKVELHVGTKASAADIQVHAQIADLMLNYKGLGGRLRRLLDAFMDLFKRPPDQRPLIGSRAWEARLELIKLDRMMRQRHSDLALYVKDVAQSRDLALEARLRNDLDVLKLQYDEHSAVLSEIDVGLEKGRGYVAAEGLSQGEQVRKERGYPDAPPGYHWRFRNNQLEVVSHEGGKKLIYDEAKTKFVEDTGPTQEPRFDAGIDRRKAFRELGGYDENSSFGKFVEMLMQKRIISSRQDVIDLMQTPGNLTHRTVRSNVKGELKIKLVDLITNPSYLKKTSRYREVLKETGNSTQALRAAANEELTQISKMISSEDSGSIGEMFYQKMYGGEKAWQHVGVSKEALAEAKGVDISEIEGGREIDRFEGDEGSEIKTGASSLGPRDRGQIADMISMLGRNVSYKGQTKIMKKAKVVFQDPLGGKANARLAYEVLRGNPDANLTFEFHTKDGRIIRVTSKNKDILLKDDFAKRLGVEESE